MTYNFKTSNGTISLSENEIIDLYIDGKIENDDWKMLANSFDRFGIGLTRDQIQSVADILVNNDYDSICAYFSYF